MTEKELHAIKEASAVLMAIRPEFSLVSDLNDVATALKDAWEEIADLKLDAEQVNETAIERIAALNENNAKLKEKAAESYKNGWEEGYKDCEAVYEREDNLS